VGVLAACSRIRSYCNEGNFHKYFSRLAFLSQARRARRFARSARRARIANLFPPSSRASHKMQRSPCLAHKAPVMQARSHAICFA